MHIQGQTKSVALSQPEEQRKPQTQSHSLSQPQQPSKLRDASLPRIQQKPASPASASNNDTSSVASELAVLSESVSFSDDGHLLHDGTHQQQDQGQEVAQESLSDVTSVSSSSQISAREEWKKEEYTRHQEEEEQEEEEEEVEELEVEEGESNEADVQSGRIRVDEVEDFGQVREDASDE